MDQFSGVGSAAGADRAEELRSERYFYRLRGRAEGFPEAIEAVYPRTEVQLCIVHLVRASLHRSLRTIINTRGGFPNDEAALKLLFFALRHAAKKWTMTIHQWREALDHS
jgi:transposase-like protein